MESSGFDDLEKRLKSDGAEAAFDHLVEQLKDENRLRDVFQVLLMKKRHQLGLAVHGDLDHEALTDSVRQEIESRSQRPVSIAAVYAALDRLERRGFAEPWFSEPTPERGGRAKKHFRLTSEGIEALDAARAAMDRMWEGLDLRADKSST